MQHTGSTQNKKHKSKSQKHGGTQNHPSTTSVKNCADSLFDSFFGPIFCSNGTRPTNNLHKSKNIAFLPQWVFEMFFYNKKMP